MKNLFFLSAAFIALTAWVPKKAILTDDDWLPPGFNPATATLLIMSHPLGEKQNDRMVKFLDEEYPYKYEIVNMKDLEVKMPDKYQDVKKYPYLLMWNFETTEHQSGPTGTDKIYGADLYGHFVDLATKQTYPSQKKLNGYGQIGYRPYIKKLVKKFEK